MIERDLHVDRAGAGFEDEPFSEHRYPTPIISLIQVLTHLAHRKWFVAKVTGIATAVGLTLSLTLPVKYTAITKIMPPQQTQSSASILMNQLTNSGAVSLAAATGGGLGLKSPNDIYIGLLKSRPVADAIIQNLDLTQEYHANDMTANRNILAENTLVTSDQSGLIAISVTDRDKKRAAAIANAYTEQLRVITKNLAVTEASQRRLFYEEQLKRAKEDLIAAEYSFQQVQQKKGLIQLDTQAKAMIANLAVLRAQISAKEVELRVLRSYSTENNPDVQLAESQRSSLQQEAARLQQRSHSSGFSDLGLEDVPGAGLDYLRAEHELQYRQTLFDLLIKQYDVARLDEAKDAAVIQVVEPAISPDQRSSPHRAWIVLTLMILGFLGSCFYLFVGYLARGNSDFHRSLNGLKSALANR